MKLLYIILEEDYKHIPHGEYCFDNQFELIKFNSEANYREIVLKKNSNYHHPFNKNLNNISCVVGKNGMGKTTFFELIIAPLLWRLDEPVLVGKIHLLFYDEIDKSFFIESYIDNSEGWHLTLNEKNENIYKNIYTQNYPKRNKNNKHNINEKKFSVMPFQMNIIFHSLSPFDRIYDLLKQQLSYASDGQKTHYKKRLKYIGIKQIENDETSYEYMTLINLISVLLDEKSSLMFNKLGYEYGEIEVSIQNEDGWIEIKIPEYYEFKKANKILIDELFTETTYNDLKEDLWFESKSSSFNEVFFKDLLVKSLKINTPKNFVNLLKIIHKNEQNLSTENVKKYIFDYINSLDLSKQMKPIYDDEIYQLLIDVYNYKEELSKIDKFDDKEYLKKIIKDGSFLILLKYIKRLARNGFIAFKMNLYKDGEPFDYLRLSSGEKTLLSYFANIMGRIRELDDIQGEDSTYKNVINKSYLILIDEVELHLHPEWQRNFVKQLNDFFTYEDNTKKFQFVIATHSPFVVTDIYDDNIIYMGGEPNSKTFGGNIFDIFKDDFYVSNSIGAFSEDIIKDLSEILYILFAMKKAEKEDNFFMLRDYFDLMYESTDKDEENINLLKEIEDYLMNPKSKMFSKISQNRFIPLRDNSLIEFENIKDNIGEEVVKNHLDSMLNYIRDKNA
jgi:predicted ATP-binding protein involved in virulence